MAALFFLQGIVSSQITLYLQLCLFSSGKNSFCGNSSPTSSFTVGFLTSSSTSWPCGCLVENSDYWGSGKFLRYFFFCGIGAGPLHGRFFPVSIYSCGRGFRSHLRNPFGVWLAFPKPPHLRLLPCPHSGEVFCYHLRPHRTLCVHAGNRRGIAHLTHLGGLIFGILYMATPTVRQKFRRNLPNESYPRESLEMVGSTTNTIFSGGVSLVAEAPRSLVNSRALILMGLDLYFIIHHDGFELQTQNSELWI